MEKKKIVIISGPTASGKSSFAIQVAKKFNGEIISCDSMQIYKHLDIGTAKILNNEMDGVPHHLLDIINPNEEFSVEEYVRLAKEKINEITQRGKLPIIVGGTCFYIKALISPYSFCSSPKDEKIRAYYNDFLEKYGKEKLYEILKDKDFDASTKIHANDTKRVIRALEIFDTKQTTKTELNSQDLQEEVYDSVFVILYDDRHSLYQKINSRVDKMFETGLVDEFRTNTKKYNLNEKSQSMQAIGYKELFLLEDNNLTDVKELIKQHTRNYAKRQLTFLRSFKDAQWFDPKNHFDNALKYIQKRLYEKER